MCKWKITAQRFSRKNRNPENFSSTILFGHMTGLKMTSKESVSPLIRNMRIKIRSMTRLVKIFWKMPGKAIIVVYLPMDRPGQGKVIPWSGMTII